MDHCHYFNFIAGTPLAICKIIRSAISGDCRIVFGVNLLFSIRDLGLFYIPEKDRRASPNFSNWKFNPLPQGFQSSSWISHFA